MIDEIISERRKKIDILRENGLDPYPVKSKRTITVADFLKKFSENQAKSKIKKDFLVGRVRGLRDQGRILFVDFEDESGRIQAVLKYEQTKNFEIIKKTLDVGDFIQVSGFPFVTNSGQKSIAADSALIISKSLRPIPNEYYGIENKELRLRKRYLDSILNWDVRQMFRKKAIFWKTVREFLDNEGFLEVETPVLESTPGGADAEPFITHYNALNKDFYLRISLEISLKKMLVGGFEKIYEIGRVFRNEGIDDEHLQDYTQCEFYWAYSDYNDLMKLVERLFKLIIKNTVGSLTTTWKGNKIEWGKKWKVVDYCQEFRKEIGIDPLTASEKDLFKKAKELKLDPQKGLSKGRLIDLIYKKKIRPNFIQPIFLINPPVELVPLAKRMPQNPKVVERMQVVACGTELGNGFSEANDPIDQRERFEEQMRLREKGDREAQRLDEEFLEALEYGMPPASGFGFSERFFAVLMDKSVRETVFFPPMKPKND
jgi:lysyl-tRNA synthetase class 2